MSPEDVDPFANATVEVFKTALGCEIRYERASLKQCHAPAFEVSGIISLTGKVHGAVVLSVSLPVAFKLVHAMLDLQVSEVNSDVTDAVGELTNMIAGGAKTSLTHYQLSLGLPEVITGNSREIAYPESAQPVCISFASDWGALAVELGLVPRQEAKQLLCAQC